MNRTDAQACGAYPSASSADTNLDIMLIPTGAVSNRIYVGGRDSNDRRTVVGGGAPFVGELLCQSGNTSAGATGGPVCNLEATASLTAQAWSILRSACRQWPAATARCPPKCWVSSFVT
jgi:hypothetical protein